MKRLSATFVTKLRQYFYIHSNVCFFLAAFLFTALVYGVFFAQADNSDIVTFSKAGDAMLQNLPLFVRNGKLLANGIFDGIDNLVTNGSNTIHTPTLMINGYNSPPLAA